MFVRVGIPHLISKGLHWGMFLTLSYNYLRSPFVQALLCQPVSLPKPGLPTARYGQGRPSGWSWDELLSHCKEERVLTPRACRDKPQNTRVVNQVLWPSCVWNIPVELQARKSTEVVNRFYNREPEQR